MTNASECEIDDASFGVAIEKPADPLLEVKKRSTCGIGQSRVPCSEWNLRCGPGRPWRLLGTNGITEKSTALQGRIRPHSG